MDLRKRVNISRYLFFTTATTLFCLLILEGRPSAVYGVLSVHFATLLNHYMLLLGVDGMTREVRGLPGIKKNLLVFYFLGKITIIFAGLSLGVHFMGDKVIIPLINYILQIFILVLSMRKTGT